MNETAAVNLHKTNLRRWLAILLLGTFLLKCLLILVHGNVYNYHSDDRGYLESARILLEQGTFTYNDPSKPTVFITPALPGTLAFVMLLVGKGAAAEQVFRILQAGMVTAALWVLFLIGRRIYNEKTAFWAVVLSSFYPPLWLVSNFIFTEAMFTLAVMLLVYAALRAKEQPSFGWAALFGLLWAVAVYVRPTIALWPGLFFLLLLYWRQIPWGRLVRCGLVTALVFVLCLLPWWVRNYEVSGGKFIPLTKAGGNPLRLGTYPYTIPALFMEEQQTWHTTNDLWINDEEDTKQAVKRIKEGFRDHFFVYASWYTVGKFALFWGDVFYWMPIPGVPLLAAVLFHYAILLLGFAGLFGSLRNRSAVLIIVLLGYMSLLHMIYLAHSRYSAPLMPFMALFAAHFLAQRIAKRRNRKIPA